MALVAWYKLDGNVLDSTHNKNNGTLHGSPTVVNDGPIGTCYSFNPDTADWIVINNLSQFIYNTPFTISAWIKTPGLGTDQTANGIVGLTYGLRFNIASDGKPYISLYNGTSTINLIGTTNCYDNKWHHIVGSYDGSSMKIYVDGILENSNISIISNISWTNEGIIGRDTNDSVHYRFNGCISDVKIYDEALSLKEIKELSKAKILHYDFNLELLDSTVVYDKSGYGYNGTITEATAPTYVTESPVGNGSYQYSGTEYITPDSNVMDILIKNSFTISFWLYSNDVSGIIADVFGGGSYGNTQGGVAFSHYTSNGWYQDMYLVTSGRKAMSVTASTIPYNQWNHIIIIRDRNNLCNKMYVNDNLVNTLTNVPDEDIIWNKTTFKLKIGKGYYSGTQGKIADFRIYATALSADDVKEIYQTRASYDKKGNIFVNNVDNGDILWDNEINSINLVTNGSAELENNTNFSEFTYINTDSYDGNGCFYKAGNYQSGVGEFIKINKDDTYFLSGYFKSVGSSGLNSRLYYGIVCCDYLKRTITADMVCHFTNTETYLIQAISNGDTIIYVNSVVNWHDSSYSLTNRRIGVYYNNEKVKFSNYTYTRLTAYYSDIDTVNNTITLTTAWSGGNVPSGTAVANHYDANTYQYISAGYASVPTSWTKYVNNTGVSGWGINNLLAYFRYGTEYVRLLFLLNYGQDSTYALEIDNLKFWNTKAQAKAINTQITNTGLTATEISEVGITEGLVAYYPLNGDAKDYSGNGNHGTVYGATMATGINGKKCYSFDGTNDYIQALGSIESNNDFTISMWYYPTRINVTYDMLYSGTDNIDIQVFFHSNTKKLTTSIENVEKTSNLTLTNDTINKWYNITFTYNYNIRRIFINGILDSEFADTTEFIKNDTNIRFGALLTGGYFLQGKIQDVRIYNRALTDKEIYILYNMYNPNINQIIQINKENILYTKGNIKEV